MNVIFDFPNLFNISMKLREIEYLKPKAGLFYKNKSAIYSAYGDKIGIDLSSIYNYSLLLDVTIREKFISNGMYALITTDFLDALAYVLKDKHVLEIMSGRGYLSRGLADRNITIHTVDDMSWRDQLGWPNKSYIKTEKLDAIKSVAKYGKYVDVIIMSWCPYQSTIDNEVLEMMREVNPNCTLLVISEGSGGCIGSDLFHSNANTVFPEVSIFLNKYFESWDGIHDRVIMVK